jgi:hypothetical protein
MLRSNQYFYEKKQNRQELLPEIQAATLAKILPCAAARTKDWPRKQLRGQSGTIDSEFRWKNYFAAGVSFSA